MAVSTAPQKGPSRPTPLALSRVSPTSSMVPLLLPARTATLRVSPAQEPLLLRVLLANQDNSLKKVLVSVLVEVATSQIQITFVKPVEATVTPVPPRPPVLPVELDTLSRTPQALPVYPHALPINSLIPTLTPVKAALPSARLAQTQPLAILAPTKPTF
jgi:hypothetical protein